MRARPCSGNCATARPCSRCELPTRQRAQAQSNEVQSSEPARDEMESTAAESAYFASFNTAEILSTVGGLSEQDIERLLVQRLLSAHAHA